MKNCLLIPIVFTFCSALAAANTLSCHDLLSQITETKEKVSAQTELELGKFKVKIVRDSLSRIQSLELSKPMTLKKTESAIKFPEVLDQILPNEKYASTLKVQVDQKITLSGAGEFSGLEITRSTIKGVDKVQLTVNQFIEKIGDKQTFVSVVTKGVDVPANFEITIGGEIKKISSAGKHLKLKCD